MSALWVFLAGIAVAGAALGLLVLLASRGAARRTDRQVQ